MINIVLSAIIIFGLFLILSPILLKPSTSSERDEDNNIERGRSKNKIKTSESCYYGDKGDPFDDINDSYIENFKRFQKENGYPLHYEDSSANYLKDDLKKDYSNHRFTRISELLDTIQKKLTEIQSALSNITNLSDKEYKSLTNEKEMYDKTLQRAEQIFSFFESDSEYLTSSSKFTVHKLITEHLPELWSTYNDESISNLKKLTTVDIDSPNRQELFIDSLDKINILFDVIVQELTESSANNINTLKYLNRYFSDLTNNH